MAGGYLQLRTTCRHGSSLAGVYPLGVPGGEEGARYKTPLLEAELAMQMLPMHRADEHGHLQVVAGETANVRRSKAEKVSRPSIKLGVSEDDFVYSSGLCGAGDSVRVINLSSSQDQLVMEIFLTVAGIVTQDMFWVLQASMYVSRVLLHI